MFVVFLLSSGGSSSRSFGGSGEGLVDDELCDGSGDGKGPGDDADRGVRADLGAGVVLDRQAAEGAAEEREADGPRREEEHGRHDGDDGDRLAGAVANDLAGRDAEADERADEADEEHDDGDDLERGVGGAERAEVSAAGGVRVADAVGAVDEEPVRVDADLGEGSGDGRDRDTDGDEEENGNDESLGIHCFDDGERDNLVVLFF